MVDYIFIRKIFRIREMAFCSLSDIDKKNVDIVYLHSNDTENKLKRKKGGISQKQFTLTSFLTEEEDALFEKIKKNCRYEIKRAIKENAKFTVYDSKDVGGFQNVIDNFEVVYNKMFIEKGLGNRFNRRLVEAGITHGQLIVTTCTSQLFENCVVYHAYLLDGNNAVLMYSASELWGEENKEKVNAIGRMNKYLHWQDMLWLQEKNYLRYEWGGISDPETPNGIDRFKMEFGGTLESFYNYIIGYTLLGKLYCFLVNIRGLCKK